MKLQKTVCTLMALIALFSLTACHPRAKQVSKMDEELSCASLSQEIKNTEQMKAEIESNRGISGRNALGLLFWPSIVINEVTGETAEKDATKRLADLENIYAAKHCSKENVAKKNA